MPGAASAGRPVFSSMVLRKSVRRSSYAPARTVHARCTYGYGMHAGMGWVMRGPPWRSRGERRAQESVASNAAQVASLI
eukprot:4206042-Prymnesium_polylepis.1